MNVVVLDDKAKAAIEQILKRGNDAKVKRFKNGVVVIEEKQEIKYRTNLIGD